MLITLAQAMDVIKAAGCNIETKIPAAKWNNPTLDNIVFVATVPLSRLNEPKEYDV